MAATTKSELVNLTRREFGKLETQILALDPDTAMLKRDDDISIKDVVAHRAHWMSLFLKWYADGQDGKQVYFPAEGYKWNDLKRYNSDLRARQADLDWSGAVALLNKNYDQLLSFIQSTSETDLYAGPMNGANNAWTVGRWAEAAGPSHFRSASKYIRTSIKKSK